MREIIARVVCCLTVVVVVALAHLFAERHNPRISVQVPASPTVAPMPSPDAVRGREVYNQQGCSSCHAIAGEGNPRNPLDEAGVRRTAVELREWITGTGAATRQLAPAVVRRKHRYQEIPDAELQALVDYLAGLAARP